MLRTLSSAPASMLELDRRGQTVGRFCRACHSVYPLLTRRHAGRPSHGKDHVGATCAYEGRPFEEGAEWWEPAVEVLPVAQTA